MAKNKARDSDSRPSKRTKLLSDSEHSDSDEEGANGVSLTNGSASAHNEDDGILKINEEFARRFEHNSKREETQRLEEKYKKNGKQLMDESDDESTSEEEDDNAQLATEELDDEIFATLKAIKSKDPRVYDPTSTFYRPIEEDAVEGEQKKEKPMYLQDYHRQNLLNGGVAGEEEEVPPQTYAQEQESLKRSMVSQMHAAGNGEAESGGDEDDFLVKKKKSAHDEFPEAAPKKKSKKRAVVVEEAEKDPETFLSNFMAARAWVPDDGGSRFQPMDSDDSEDDRRADAFEHAYNLRFEDPKSANEKLMSYGRDLNKHSVRREELTGRQRQRELEREAKEQAKRERQEEKARLRNHKIAEVEKKVKQIKEAAGLRNQDVLDLDEWGKVLEEDWDDDKWEEEMKNRFGDKYYADVDDLGASSGDEAQEQKSKKKKTKKPKWTDEVDIKDLVPEFEEEDETENPAFTLSDDDETSPVVAGDADEDAMEIDTTAAPTKKDHKRIAADKKRAARKERQAISDLVDTQLSTTLPSSSKTKASQGAFRYRETSPSNFGLTARDILFADDTQLNQFAGLKKMAAFRDEEKKRRDRKTLGKKARLRQWRRDTFGDEKGYKGEFADYVKEKGGDAGMGQTEGSGKTKGKKRKAAT